MADTDRLNYPGAPPDKVRGAIETLFLEWQSVQSERAQWKLERSQLRARIIQLESEARNHEKVRLDLIRRIKLLEHGLLSERMNYVSGAAPSKFASNFGANGIAGKPGRSESHLSHGHPTSKGRFYRTLPSDFLASPGAYMRNMSPGRQFLREYLIELGYIKEAEQLDPRHTGIVESKFEQEPVKLAASSSKGAISISVKREALPSDSEWAVSSNSPDKPKGSYAKPNVKPTSVTAARRGSADALLLEQKTGDSKRWKSTVSLRSHMDSVRCLSWHSTEAAIVTGSEDGTAKFWNLSDEISLAPNKKKKANPLEPNFTFRGHRGMVTSVVLADQLKRVFTAGTDSKIFVWDVPPLNLDTYDELGRATRFRRQVLDGHKDAVWNLCVHPVAAQGLLFSASSDSTVFTWKIDGDNPVKLINQTAHIDSKSHLTAIPTTLTVMNSDMKKLLVGFKSGEVGQVDIETGKVIRVMTPTADTNATSSSNTGNFHINDIVSHPSLSLAVTAHVDNNVRIFDVSQGSCVSVMQTHRDAVTSVALDPSGLYLASASHDQSLRFWDMSSKKIIQDLDGYQTHRSKFDEAIHMVRYHPSMPLVASCGADSFAKVYQ